MVSWERGLQVGLLLVSCSSCLAGKSSGANATFTAAAMEYGTRMFTLMVEQKMNNFHIPASKGEMAAPFGTIEYYTKYMYLTDFQIGHTSMDAAPDSAGLNMIISAESCQINGDWGYRVTGGFFLMSDVGRFKARISSVYIDVVVAMDENDSTVSLLSCSAGVRNIELVFEGGASWIYNLLSPIIAEGLKGQLGEMMCESVEKTMSLGGGTGKTSSAC